nr:DUF3107 domain-containing protein [Actinomyces ruminis]
MQVTIGIKHSTRELQLETSASQEEVLAAVADAATSAVTLTDDKGRKVFIPAGSLATSTIGEAPPAASASASESPRGRRRLGSAPDSSSRASSASTSGRRLLRAWGSGGGRGTTLPFPLRRGRYQ